jgi:hypothetical protein
MEAYDETIAPQPFSLNNTGVICYFNSLLQALAGQPAFLRAILKHEEYMKKTRTGRAVWNFVNMFVEIDASRKICARAKASEDTINHSSLVLAALVQDLKERRPDVRFGASQESASEGLVHLLDMIEPPVMVGNSTPPRAIATEGKPTHQEQAPGPGGDTVCPVSVESPITRLFLHRYQCEVYCTKCRNRVSTMTDLAVQFHLFYFDKLREPQNTIERFSGSICRHVTLVEDYRCPTCKEGLKTCPCDHCIGLRAADAQAEKMGQAKPPECKCAHCDCKGNVYRLYRLSMIPEIAVCLFNLYGRPRPQRFIPKQLRIPAKAGGTLVFNQTAMIEHFGSLDGGHYIARALRAGHKVYLFNDHADPEPNMFVASPNTYIAMYHFGQLEAAAHQALSPVSTTTATSAATAVTDIITGVTASLAKLKTSIPPAAEA